MQGNGLEQWSIQFRLPELHRHELLAGFADMPEVVSIDMKLVGNSKGV
jgi:hypothetical protein